MNQDDIRIINTLKRFKIYGLTRRALKVKDKGILNAFQQENNNEKSIEFEISKKDLFVFYNNDVELKELQKSSIVKLKEKYKFNIKYIKVVKHYTNNCNNQISICDLISQFKYKAFIYYCKKAKFDTSLVYNCILCNNYDELETKLNSPLSLKLFANYCNVNNVSVRTSTFYDFKGKNYYSGGAERYLIDLHEILSKRGINMDVYQDADIPFFRKYRDLNIIGLPLKNQPMDWSEKHKKERAMNYINVAKKTSQLHIYSAFYEAYPAALSPSIGISHGIAWDNESNKFSNGLNFEVEKKMIIEGASLCDKLVSVDTNTANWFQTLDYEMGAQKFEVISNYVDVNEFKPRDDYLEKRDKIIITYPRRLYAARGMYSLLNITDKLINKHDNIEIHFVGKGFDKDLKEIEKKVKKYPNKVFCYSKDPKEMYEIYKNSDISLIPTKYSEGTSLSCLEAMASGNIVIATRIGGLTDLIFDGYNGYLIEPNDDALFRAIDDAIINYQERLIMKTRAIEVAKSFNKEKWKEKWNRVFEKFELNKKDSKNTELVEFYLSDFENISKSIFEKISKELLDNKCVYIRIIDDAKIDLYINKYSGEMLQFISYKEEIVTNEHKIYVDKKVENKIKISEKYSVI